MNINISSNDEKLLFLEEVSGLYNESSFHRRNRNRRFYSQFIPIMKLILYLELIFFIGWIGCLVLSNDISPKDSKSQMIHLSNRAFPVISISSVNEMRYEYVTRNRDRRSSEEVESEMKACESRLNATRNKVNQWNKQFIIGDSADPIIEMLREKCRDEMVALTMRTLTRELISSDDMYSPTTEEWRSFALEVKNGILNNTNGEHRQQVETSDPPTDKMIDELRETIGSMSSDYKSCERYISFGIPSTSPSMADFLNGREMCIKQGTMFKKDVRLLAKQMIPGNDSDEEIPELLGQVRSMTISIANEVGEKRHPDWNDTTAAAVIANVSQARWREYIVHIGSAVISSTDSERRQHLTQSNPESDALINTLRRVVTNFVINFQYCEALTHNITDIRKRVEADMDRTKRAIGGMLKQLNAE